MLTAALIDCIYSWLFITRNPAALATVPTIDAHLCVTGCARQEAKRDHIRVAYRCSDRSNTSKETTGIITGAIEAWVLVANDFCKQRDVEEGMRVRKGTNQKDNGHAASA